MSSMVTTLSSPGRLVSVRLRRLCGSRSVVPISDRNFPSGDWPFEDSSAEYCPGRKILGWMAEIVSWRSLVDRIPSPLTGPSKICGCPSWSIWAGVSFCVR